MIVRGLVHFFYLPLLCVWLKFVKGGWSLACQKILCCLLASAVVMPSQAHVSKKDAKQAAASTLPKDLLASGSFTRSSAEPLKNIQTSEVSLQTSAFSPLQVVATVALPRLPGQKKVGRQGWVHAITGADVQKRALLFLLMADLPTHAQAVQACIAQSAGALVQFLVDDTMKLYQSRRFKLAPKKPQIKSVLEKMARTLKKPSSFFTGGTKALGLDVQFLEDHVSAQLGWNQYVQAKNQHLTVSDQEVRAFMQRYEQALKQDAYAVRELVIDAAAPQAAAQVAFVQHQLTLGAPFVVLAEQLSHAPSARQAGDMGWVLLSQLPKEVQDQLKGIAPEDMPMILGPVAVKTPQGKTKQWVFLMISEKMTAAERAAKHKPITTEEARETLMDQALHRSEMNALRRLRQSIAHRILWPKPGKDKRSTSGHVAN